MNRNKRFLELNRKSVLSEAEAAELKRMKDEAAKFAKENPLPELSAEQEAEIEKELRRRGWS